MQEKFIKERGITYPFLSDIEAYSIQALGILNEDYQPDDEHLGIFILDNNMKIVGKIFVNAYEKRVNAQC